MKMQIQNLIRMANRTGYCERVFPIMEADYDFFCVELSGMRGLHYEAQHSHVLKVTSHRRFENDRVREYRNIALTGDIIQDTDMVLALVQKACKEFGVTYAESL